jgi:pyruvate kinase
MTSQFRRTRIVATLGPASSSREKIAELVKAGVNVFRLNFSHGSHEDHRRNYDWIREVSEEANLPIGVLQDLQGPKIRTETFADGAVELVSGKTFTLTCDDNSPGDVKRVGVTYRNLCEDVAPGDQLLLDDGRLSLQVTAVNNKKIQTRVLRGGKLSNNKGINIPGRDLSIPALSEKDVEDLMFGAELGVDWVAISFVRNRDDLILARHYLGRAGSRAKLMAKIEKPSAVDKFEEILDAADGIMVARGDLGVEMSADQVPLIQKKLIRAARRAAKPVVTATQMLESMINNPQPTRAEASDVANAIYDGTDAVMLSAETAVGEFAYEAVCMMDRIALSVEGDKEFQRRVRQLPLKGSTTTADAVSSAACDMAEDMQAAVTVAFTQSGSAARRVSRYRSTTPVVAITPSVTTYRQMALSWGVLPTLGEAITSTDDMVTEAERILAMSGLIDAGDRYVITAGVPFGVRGSTNMIRVERLQAN